MSMDLNRVAVFSGINRTPKLPLLYGCRKDAATLCERFEKSHDHGAGYECYLHTDRDKPVTTRQLREAVNQLFHPANQFEVALFYFSGHGAIGGISGNRHGFYLMTSNAESPEDGLSMSDVLESANRAEKIQQKIIVLDCCHAGQMGGLSGFDGFTTLSEGISILAATRAEGQAMEFSEEDEKGNLVAHGGIFTQFVLEALNGAAADALGKVTIASIYSYVDLRLGLMQQRPVFKANISRMTSVFMCPPRIEIKSLKEGLQRFATATTSFDLDQSYEPDDIKNRIREPNLAHVAIFRIFQKMRALGLLEPVEGEHLYWAAVDERPCRLTSLGQVYWHAVKERKL